MRLALFYQSLVSDWNHGNAHFLRGVVSELQAHGHSVRVFEPEDSWSRTNLLRDHGPRALADFESAFPNLRSTRYRLESLHLEEQLGAVDLLLVHEWNDPELVAKLGRWRSTHRGARLLFHDTHHRAITAPDELARFDLAHYDGVLAYGASLKEAYQRLGWGKQVFVWHEAADTRVFYPRPSSEKAGDVIWVGNWGDDERTEELSEFLIDPVRRAQLRACVYGVRYPSAALTQLGEAGIEFGGWVANFRVPELFARFRATVHVPRRPYVRTLAGIPTIRPFEALACGIPLVCAPWHDAEELFRPGRDYLLAENGKKMQKHLTAVLEDRALASSLIQSGLETIRSRHTCRHRVEELMRIYRGLSAEAERKAEPAAAGVAL